MIDIQEQTLSEIVYQHTIGQHPAHSMPFDDLYQGLTERVSQGLLNVRKYKDLELFTYTVDCVYERKWDIFTLVGRGLVVCPLQKKIVVTCLPKFFNYGEVVPILPKISFSVTEKLDGSAGLCFFWDGEWLVITKGSFESEQAIWATKELNNNILTHRMDKSYTYFVEIIYPENRIVVKYDFEGLVLLTIYNNEGYELDRTDLELEAKHINMRIVDIKDYKTIQEMLDVAMTLDLSSEGFVVRFENGFRIKIKGENYIRVHRLISDCTPLAIWRMLKECDNLESLRKDLPEEFRKDFDKIKELLEAQFNIHYQSVKDFYELTKDSTDKKLGLALNDKFLEAPKIAKQFVFACRNKNWLVEVLQKPEGNGHSRNKFFKCFRPTGNQIEGYTPSDILNRFDEESA